MDSFVLTFLILILLFFLFSDQVFFDTLYNNKIGRFVLIILLIVISIINIWLSFLFLMIIVYYSQINKTHTETQKENFDKMDRLNVSDVLNNSFLYKNYKTDFNYKKTKREGMTTNIVKESEKLRPKSSKTTMISGKISKNVVPYSKNNYFNL